MIRGVILAGGTGSRLGELTKHTNKHLLPVGDKPMLSYAIEKMVVADIKEIMIVTTPKALVPFYNTFGLGVENEYVIKYAVQEQPGGIAQALALTEEFVDGESCYVVLGDNIFYDLLPHINQHKHSDRAWVMLKRLPDVSRYGVAIVDDVTERIMFIDEKPANPKSDMAVVGIYSYPPDVFDVIRTIKPSPRGELEITDVNNHYVRTGKLDWYELDGWWVDAGTPKSLEYANKMVEELPPLF